MPPHYFPTTNQPSRLQKIMHTPNTSTSGSILSVGLSKKDLFDSFFVPLPTWSLTCLQKHYHLPKSNISQPNWVSCRFEGECWSCRGKHTTTTPVTFH